ncbi:MAG: GDSL-type esterase/lipase family protein [Propionibacteriaceae bacterium]|jgi:lysophospholipase L1-like esterase|nr:GDSL-type esterase/lipase family protein [Propionibacteriaceae bacterium]
MSRLTRILVAAGFVVASCLAPLTMSQAGAAESPPRQLSLVVLGDSYSAGNGTGTVGWEPATAVYELFGATLFGYTGYWGGTYNGPQGSYRSPYNYASLYTRWLNQQPGVHASLTNLAWSGETTAGVLAEQVGAVPSQTDLVLMTIGGNDVEFAEIVKQCFAIGFRDAKTCERKIAAAQAGLDQVAARTTAILQALESRLDADAQVVLLGYPYLAAKNSGYALGSLSLLGLGYRAADQLRALQAAASLGQERLVSAWNGSHRLRAVYLNVADGRFGGHEPDPRADGRNAYRWLNEFVETAGYRLTDRGWTLSRPSFDMNNWYHPNLIGHAAYAQALVETIGVPDTADPVVADGGDIDIAFAIDATGSMGGYIAAARQQVATMVEAVRASAASVRFALVSYRDYPQAGGAAGDYPYRLEQAFTTDTAALEAKLAALEAPREAGGDPAESVYAGARATFDLDWRTGARKITIVVGDAGPKDPEPISGDTWEALARVSYRLDPVQVYGVDAGGLATVEFANLVAATGGQIFPVSSPDQLAEAVVTAARTALAKPFAWLQGPFVDKVGATLTLDARGSYALDGDLVSYEWDFDGDGRYDQTTMEPTLNHVFPDLLDAVVGVRVTDQSGRTAVATTPIQLTDDGDTVPAELDNCPTVANHGQTDYDQDGVGDECDDTPGYPTADQEDGHELPAAGPSPEPTEPTVEPSPSEASSQPTASPSGALPAVATSPPPAGGAATSDGLPGSGSQASLAFGLGGLGLAVLGGAALVARPKLAPLWQCRGR